jgi:hypothetical protein
VYGVCMCVRESEGGRVWVGSRRGLGWETQWMKEPEYHPSLGP